MPPPPHFQVLGGGGGTGYLFSHYWPPVKREPAINVDMVNCNRSQVEAKYNFGSFYR